MLKIFQYYTRKLESKIYNVLLHYLQNIIVNVSLVVVAILLKFDRRWVEDLSLPPTTPLCDHQWLQGESETVAKGICNCMIPSKNIVVRNMDRNGIRSITGSRRALHLSTYDLCSSIKKVSLSHAYVLWVCAYYITGSVLSSYTCRYFWCFAKAGPCSVG